MAITAQNDGIAQGNIVFYDIIATGQQRLGITVPAGPTGINMLMLQLSITVTVIMAGGFRLRIFRKFRLLGFDCQLQLRAVMVYYILAIVRLETANILCICWLGKYTGALCQSNADRRGLIQHALHIYQLACRQIQIGCISSDFCAAADMNFRQAGICSHHQTIDLSSGHIQRTGNIHITTGIFIGITACDTTTGHI